LSRRTRRTRKLEAGAMAVKVMKLLAMAGVILLLLAMARASRWRQTWISARPGSCARSMDEAP
jgi:hypothetical protein